MIFGITGRKILIKLEDKEKIIKWKSWSFESAVCLSTEYRQANVYVNLD